MENKHIKRCTISFVFMEMQIIITMRYHCTAPKMARKQKQKQTNEKLITPKANVDSEQVGL